VRRTEHNFVCIRQLSFTLFHPLMLCLCVV
jgi:hypothetical protein